MSSRRVLVIGATGFLGRRLTLSLLREGAEVWILVRSTSKQAFGWWKSRVEEEDPGLFERLTVVEGDLLRPEIVADPHQRSDLLRDVTEIYHLGGAVHLAALRERAYDVNITGTRHVLQLAREVHDLKRLHYASCTLVAGDWKEGPFREDQLRQGQRFDNAYAESKLVAEGAVEDDLPHLPITVYRLGPLVGDSTTGKVDKIEGSYYALVPLLRLLSRLPRALRWVAAAPGGANMHVHAVPVDWAAEALVTLGEQEWTVGQTYQLTDPDPMTAREWLAVVVRSAGGFGPLLPVPALPMARFSQSDFARQAWGFIDQTLGVPREAMDYLAYRVTFDTARADEALQRVGLPCPHLRDYLPALVDWAAENLLEGNVEE